MINLPEEIRIGYRTYQVVEWNAEVAKASGKYGECDHLELVIRLDVTHGDVEVMNTLIHEILHAIFAVTGISEVTEWKEEYLVSAQASCLTQVMIDNPDLMKFLSKAAS